MAGYSGTPLARKLGIRSDLRILLWGAPPAVRSELRAAVGPITSLDVARGPVDFAMLFSDRHLEMLRRLERAEKRLSPSGLLWLCWPKQSSGVPTDLGEGVVRALGLGTGLVDVKVCAVSETWSGLKFVRRRRDRAENSPRRRTRPRSERSNAGTRDAR
jgi:hypothetical protein